MFHGGQECRGGQCYGGSVIGSSSCNALHQLQLLEAQHAVIQGAMGIARQPVPRRTTCVPGLARAQDVGLQGTSERFVAIQAWSCRERHTYVSVVPFVSVWPALLHTLMYVVHHSTGCTQLHQPSLLHDSLGALWQHGDRRTVTVSGVTHDRVSYRTGLATSSSTTGA